MKDVRIYFLFFVLAVVLVSGLHTISVVYSPSESFNLEVEDHLVSVAQVKGERLDDYFLERKRDVEVLAGSSEVKELLKSEVGSRKSEVKVVVGDNVEWSLDAIARQIEIYVGKYPGVSFEEWKVDEEFLKVVSRSVGKSGYTEFVDFDNFDRGVFDYYERVGVVTGDGVELGVAAKVDFDEFRILTDPSFELTSSMEMFRDISGYENLILVDRDGYVVYEVDGDFNLGVNLNDYGDGFLGEAYLGGEAVYGPYSDIGESELGLLFLAKVYDKGEVVGTIILEDSMEDVNGVVMEQVGLMGMSGDSYIVDEDGFLITQAKGGEFDLFVQKVDSENSEKCFFGEGNLVSYFADFKGEDVVGSYSRVSEVDWCLLVEVGYDEVFSMPKDEQVQGDLIFILGLSVVLLLVGRFFCNKFLEKRDA